jgi:membrane fusion protein, copper/silver efflux system
MKKHWKSNTGIIILLLFFGAVFMSGCRESSHKQHLDKYTCSMHPEVVSDKPGKCPVCGMDLVKQSAATDSTEVAIGMLAEEPNEVIHANITTTKAVRAARVIKLNAQGIVTYDTRFVYTIPARAGGRLEKSYTKFEYQPIRKGQRVADIYSEELVAAQREHLYLLAGNDQSLLEGSKRKLEILGFTSAQLEELAIRKNVIYSVSIFSPYSGYAIAGGSAAPAISSSSQPQASGGGMGMGSGAGSTGAGTTDAGTTSPVATGEILREGQYVQAGQPLVKVVSDNALRIELNLPSAYTPLIHKGDVADLDFGNSHAHKATIDFVEPSFSAGQEFLKVRIYTSDMKNMHIGHLVNATISIKSAESLWVPEESVVSLGVDNAVFVKEGDVFRPRRISSGIRAEGWLEVKGGLSENESIAAKAGFLVDSDSFVRFKEESK